MMSELGVGIDPWSENVAVTDCHLKHPSRLGFMRCLCANLPGLCHDAASQPATTVTASTLSVTSTLSPAGTTSPSPLVPADWTRSYSVTAGLCALFLAMCAVIIVLRIMSKHNEPQTRGRVSVSTVPLTESEPPPYEVVARLPPSYISREPPPYCEIDIDKYPSPLICPRQLGNRRTTAETSHPETTVPSGPAASRGEETANCGAETANCDAETANCGAETANCGAQTANRGAETTNLGAETANCDAEAANCGAEAANCGAEAANCAGEPVNCDEEGRGSHDTATAPVGGTAGADSAAASTSSGAASSCLPEVTVVSEVTDSRAASTSSGEGDSR